MTMLHDLDDVISELSIDISDTDELVYEQTGTDAFGIPVYEQVPDD